MRINSRVNWEKWSSHHEIRVYKLFLCYKPISVRATWRSDISDVSIDRFADEIYSSRFCFVKEIRFHSIVIHDLLENYNK